MEEEKADRVAVRFEELEEARKAQREVDLRRQAEADRAAAARKAAEGGGKKKKAKGGKKKK